MDGNVALLPDLPASSRRRPRRYCSGQGCSTRPSRHQRSAGGLDDVLAFRGETRFRLGVMAELELNLDLCKLLRVSCGLCPRFPAPMRVGILVAWWAWAPRRLLLALVKGASKLNREGDCPWARARQRYGKPNRLANPGLGHWPYPSPSLPQFLPASPQIPPSWCDLGNEDGQNMRVYPANAQPIRASPIGGRFSMEYAITWPSPPQMLSNNVQERTSTEGR